MSAPALLAYSAETLSSIKLIETKLIELAWHDGARSGLFMGLLVGLVVGMLVGAALVAARGRA